MSWFAELADKAENLLEKIDKKSAAALKIDNNGILEKSAIQNKVLPAPQFSKIDIDECLLNIEAEDPKISSTSGIEISKSAASHLDSSFPINQTILNSTNLKMFTSNPKNINVFQNEVLDDRNTENASSTDFSFEISEENHFTEKPQIAEIKELVSKEQAEKDKSSLKEQIENLTIEKEQLYREINDLRSSLDRNRFELDRTRSDLEQHKARASKTLQEKEKLISELKKNTNTEVDDVAFMEMNQLRQERKILQEENRQIGEQLRSTRQELLGAEMKLEKMRQQSIESNVHAQESIITERKRRLDAEEDVKLHIEEIRSLKEELALVGNKYSTKSKKLETEISRLRSQLSAMSTPSSEVESRLTTLTQTLVSKQQALEILTTERNALRLQLEKVEQNYRDMRDYGKNSSYENANDTDDAKAQMPTFLMETPFDTSVTRRMKRAYSILDAISIRTGVFLRRYPLARILILIYMVLLHFWVLIVLLSQSPDAH